MDADRRRGLIRRRRLLLAASVLCGAIGCGVLSSTFFAGSGGPAAAAPRETTAVAAPRSVVAVAGDSLWSIAERHHGDVGVADYVELLVALNGGPVVRSGDLVRLPA